MRSVYDRIFKMVFRNDRVIKMELAVGRGETFNRFLMTRKIIIFINSIKCESMQLFSLLAQCHLRAMRNKPSFYILNI